MGKPPNNRKQCKTKCSLGAEIYGIDLKCSRKPEKGTICVIIRDIARPYRVNRVGRIRRGKRKES